MGGVSLYWSIIIDSKPLNDPEEQDIGGRKAMGFWGVLELHGRLE